MIEYKGYQIKPSKETPHSYVIVTAGRGGKIPAVMQGLFTSTGVAKQAVDLYVGEKEQDNVEKVSKG
jgi:hypothetical protein